jgi:hypothetical protein
VEKPAAHHAHSPERHGRVRHDHLIVFITVIFSIANTLIMSIIERFHEPGVMKSIGTRPSHIFLW